jgi:hypothetical protein
MQVVCTQSFSFLLLYRESNAVTVDGNMSSSKSDRMPRSKVGSKLRLML